VHICVSVLGRRVALFFVRLAVISDEYHHSIDHCVQIFFIFD
jgi:hypothetical protein